MPYEITGEENFPLWLIERMLLRWVAALACVNYATQTVPTCALGCGGALRLLTSADLSQAWPLRTTSDHSVSGMLRCIAQKTQLSSASWFIFSKEITGIYLDKTVKKTGLLLTRKYA